MSTPAEAVQVIEGAILAAVADDSLISWPNVPFTPPTSGPWVKVDTIWGAATVWTKDGLNASQGIAQIGIYAPRDSGDGTLYPQAEAVRNIFDRLRVNDVLFGAANPPVALYEESWRSLVVSIPFRILE